MSFIKAQTMVQDLTFASPTLAGDASPRPGWLNRTLIAAFDRLADEALRRRELATLALLDGRDLQDIGLSASALGEFGKGERIQAQSAECAAVRLQA